MTSIKLPLRLRAEPPAKEAFKDCFVLPSNNEELLCLIVNDHGLIAFATNDSITVKEAMRMMELSEEHAPPFLLVVGNGGESKWVNFKSAKLPIVKHPRIERHPRVVTEIARVITEAIHRYYERQVLEPSIRGFLSILEKQFPRNDLYLFELLQNAVDDGAMHVKFALKRNPRRQSEGGLLFMHNGRGFTALDCLGLASVGLSTKSKAERTIGFMGVGFKAVYKRYSMVTVYDDTWAFRFEEPALSPHLEPSHGWVLKPKWAGADRGDRWDSSSSSETTQWCHFQLERPRGTMSLVEGDLKVLPNTVLSLLGRQALKNWSHRHSDKDAAAQRWVLEWGDACYAVSRQAAPAGAEFRLAVDKEWAGSGDCIVVEQALVHPQHRSRSAADASGNSSRRKWQFISVKFVPDRAAADAYASHTKRPWGGASPATAREETSLFFEVGDDGSPVVPGLPPRGALGVGRPPGGHVHSVLPTKLQLPSPVQWQGSWLLSVDRQEVQSVSDNDWNRCLLDQAPRLFASLLAWAAEARPADLRAVYALLPPMHPIGATHEPASSSSSSGRGAPSRPPDAMVTTLLGQKVRLDALMQALRRERIVPVLRAGGAAPGAAVDFVRAADAVWLPAPLVQRVPVELLVAWCGAQPLATDRLGEYMWLPLWRAAVSFPSAGRPPARLPEYRDLLGKAATGAAVASSGSWPAHVEMCLRVLAALAESTALAPPAAALAPPAVAAAAAAAATVTADALGGDWGVLPLRHWPVLLSGCGAVSATEVAWPADEFADLPRDLRMLLRPAVRAACDAPPRSAVHSVLLDEELETALLEIPRADAKPKPAASQASAVPQLLREARRFVEILREALPERVVSVEQACRQLLSGWSSQPVDGAHSGDKGHARRPSVAVLTEAQVGSVLTIFHYALQQRRPALVTHLLVDTNESNCYLLPAENVHLGRELLAADGADLEELSGCCGGRALAFASAKYAVFDPSFSSSAAAARVAEFLAKCGARRTVTLKATCRDITSEELSTFFNGKMPARRSTRTSCPVHFPYGLGEMSSKKPLVVDAALASAWADIIAALSGAAPAPCAATTFHLARTVCGLVARMVSGCAVDTAAPHATAESTPCAAAALKGRPLTDGEAADRSGQSVPEGTPNPAFCRLYHLPPGQPGASAVSLGPARWLLQLADMRWVPAAAPGAAVEAAASLLLRPSEVVLPSVSAASVPATASNATPGRLPPAALPCDMPVARLPMAVLRMFLAAPPPVQAVFKWGSEKPKPPLERLEQLVKLVAEADGVQAGIKRKREEGADDGAGGGAERYFSEFVSVWRALCTAHREGRLTANQIERIRSACCGRPGSRPLRLIPAFGRLWPLRKCLHLRGRNVISAGKDRTGEDNGCSGPSDEDLAAYYMCESGFALNVNVSSPSEKDLYRATWELSSVADALLALLGAELGAANRALAQDYLAWCVERAAVPPPPAMRKGYSFALWLLVKGMLGSPGAAQGACSEAQHKDAAAALRAALPQLAVYCVSGPQVGPDAFPARWLPVWADVGLSEVVPVLIDDQGGGAGSGGRSRCGVALSSLLCAEHRMQPLGLLNHYLHQCIDGEDTPTHSLGQSHGQNRHEHPFDTQERSALSNIEPRLLCVLGIARTSNAKAFSLKVAVKGDLQQLPEASARLQAVLLLLRAIAETSCGLHGASCGQPAPAVQLTRRQAITMQFKAPTMAEPSRKQAFAVFGAGGGREKGGGQDAALSVLIAGDADDYAPELEAVIGTLVELGGARALDAKPAAAASTRAGAMRLLYFLEDGPKFAKHLRRNFQGFLPAAVTSVEDGQAADRGSTGAGDTRQRLHALLRKVLREEEPSWQALPSRLHALGLSNAPAWMAKPALVNASAQAQAATATESATNDSLLMARHAQVSDAGNVDSAVTASEPALPRTAQLHPKQPGEPNLLLAGWEANTRGIGSKLLLAMGLEPGQGLGKGDSGITEPLLVTGKQGKGGLGYPTELPRSKQLGISNLPAWMTRSSGTNTATGAGGGAGAGEAEKGQEGEGEAPVKEVAGGKRSTAASEAAGDADAASAKRARTDAQSSFERPAEATRMPGILCPPPPASSCAESSSRVNDCLLSSYRLASQAAHRTCADMLALVCASLPIADERSEPARVILAVVGGVVEAAGSSLPGWCELERDALALPELRQAAEALQKRK